ncbi:hypothetical protein ACHAWT_006989 [Skeletonema menzelii]
MAHLKRVEAPLRYLTKSLAKKAISCPRKLVYATNPTYGRKFDPMKQHLSKEGERFGNYCKGLFPGGIEIGRDISFERRNNAPMLEVDLIDETKRLLMGEEEEQIVLFEGAVQHGGLFARPDVLVKTKNKQSNQTELQIIEIKSKSWDSRHTVESKMLTLKKSIRSTFLPYLQDVAFQTLVLRRAFPDFRISSWLMMPDRAKKLKDTLAKDGMAQSIDDSVAAVVNVDDLVEKVLNGKISYPGTKKPQHFTKAISHFSDIINKETSVLESSLSPPIGSQCMSCEYKLKDANIENKDEVSGFDVCWRAATGTKQEDMGRNQFVADIYSLTKNTLANFLNENKYTFDNLTAKDFGLDEDGEPAKKKKTNCEDTITNSQRQWLQVKSVQQQRTSSESSHYILKKGLESEMEKWQYPLHLIDFETISPALPYFSGMAPYDVVCFQFSHHILDQNHDGTVSIRQESEFLHTIPGENPNGPFLRALYNALGCVVSDGGTVFCWSSHETTVLKSILTSPEFSASLSQHEVEALSALLPERSHPMVDLFECARDYFYVDGSGGSSSIKRLLRPTMNASPELKGLYGKPTYSSNNFQNIQWYQLDESGNVIDPYDILSRLDTDKDRSAIAVGGAAAAAYHELQSKSDMTEQDRSYIQSSLLRYCELDTLSMAMFVQAWQAFAAVEKAK